MFLRIVIAIEFDPQLPKQFRKTTIVNDSDWLGYTSQSSSLEREKETPTRSRSRSSDPVQQAIQAQVKTTL